MMKIRICSLDFLIYAHELRLEEEELLDEGYMEANERLSKAEMRKCYEDYLRSLRIWKSRNGNSVEWL